MELKKQLAGIAATFLFSFFLLSCDNNDDPVPSPPFLENDEITISNIYGIPSGVSFNKIKVEIQGYDWQVIDIIEANYTDGKAVLLLPSGFAYEKLMKVAREDRSDYTGFWHADSDNANARVAGFAEISAYDNEKKVGTLILTDWSGSGSRELSANVYYHYTNEPVNLTNTQKDTNKSYTFRASFQKGWNAYAYINPLDALIGTAEGKVQCVSPVPAERKFAWYFQPIYAPQ